MLRFYRFQRHKAMKDKESYLIEKLSSPYIGDDAAVVGETLYSMDAFCEGTHFLREWMTPTQAGRKAMLVNISDAIAMNARPRYALVTVALPRDFDESDIEALIEAMESTATAYGCEIIGGDTVGSDKLHITVTVVSYSRSPLLRKGLKEGDLLAYTGTLGESARDLAALMRGEKIAEDSRFYLPVLRDGFIYEAAEYLHAGMDISDGLFCDTNKLLDANDTGMNILKNINPEIGMSGEEYEMLVGFAPEKRARIEAIAAKHDIPLTIFAEVCKNDRRFPCKSHHFA